MSDIKMIKFMGDTELKESLIFTPMYEKYMKKVIKTSSSRNRDGFISPSSIYGCKTYAINQLNGEEKDWNPNPNYDELTHIGVMIHEMYQDRGVEAGFLYDCEKYVEIPELKVKGQIDGILKMKDPKDKRKYRRGLLDIKTVTSWKFNKVKTTKKPLDQHLPQMMLYLKATDLPRVHLLYVSREYGSKIEVVQEFDQEIYDSVVKWIQEVLDYHEKKKYPPASEVFDKPHCKGCQYFKTVCNKKVYRQTGLDILG